MCVHISGLVYMPLSITQIKEHGEEGKVLVLERIINDQSVKLEDLESLVKQVIESQQTLAKTSEETIEQMQVSMYYLFCCVLTNAYWSYMLCS